MKSNVGTIDRLLRILLGLAILSLLFISHGSARWFGLIGFVPLLTATVGSCPLYTLLGVSTCRTGSRHS